ncbi:MAG: transcriptional regulator [Lautropia sp.]|nr:MAG: transcriptional regulator [Pseudomonadota bacterium]MBC6960362.1 transcriptional regulator [Lautropia sp.]MCL4702164.1 transcriptional regulator [Burkholderiaceae bacterium]MCZ2415313.1 transcriptional regulator [Burkholderiales bacterium]MDL1908108.1 transcriptional regulator [Betaproteobacteria bacterium PRO1]NUN94451.1 transcriptional regulator [Verrucomicrobiae bacterium]
MSLAGAIYSPSQAKLFRWIFGQPERSFHLNELRRLTGLGSASLQRELRRLTEAGLASAERVGTMRRFQANPESPVFHELVALTRKVLGVEPTVRHALAALAPQLRAAWIFGSIAKAADTANSDIDVMIVADDLPMSEILEALVPLEPDLGRKINPVSYTTQEFERRLLEPDSFVNRVLAQKLIPLIGDPGELAGVG